MRYWVLASGSKGNCSVVESEGKFLIIDCGGTKKYLEACFKEINIDINQASALLITHEHSDHIRQINMFRKLRVYAPFEVLSLSNESLVQPLETFRVAGFEITPIPLSHDTAETVGYVIRDSRQSLAVITDTGYLSQGCRELVKNMNYYVFESNYDTEMLMNSSRPSYLKYRIIGDSGHMSNEYSAQTLSYIIGPDTREIVLAHVSQECNTRSLAYKTLIAALESNNIDPQNYKIHVAEQFAMYKGGQ